MPTARRGLPALLVRRGGDRILLDCGEGTQRQLLRTVGLSDLTDVFLTHFHLDHWLGLPGMLKTFDLRDRDRPLSIHGPHGLERLIGSLRPLSGGRATSCARRACRRRAVGATATRSPPSPRATGARRWATHWSRRSGPGASTPTAPAPSASSRARTSAACSMARP